MHEPVGVYFFHGIVSISIYSIYCLLIPNLGFSKTLKCILLNLFALLLT